jgi:hypothetical protein
VFQHFPADAQRERPLEQALKRRQTYPEAAQRIVSILIGSDQWHVQWSPAFCLLFHISLACVFASIAFVMIVFLVLPLRESSSNDGVVRN